MAVQELLGHEWLVTTLRYVHVQRDSSRSRGSLVSSGRLSVWRVLSREGMGVMKWNLRLAAANRGIWKASELQRMLADWGLVISAGKMSGLWSGDPASAKLGDLDVLCAVLGCDIGDLLIPEPEKVRAAGEQKEATAKAVGDATSSTAPIPRRRDGRSLPPL